MLKFLCILFLLTLMPAVYGSAVVFTGSSGQYSATFTAEVVGDTAYFSLFNISDYDVTAPQDVVTGVFFNYNGPAFSWAPLWVRLAEGSSIWFGDAELGGYVGGEWAYASDLVGFPGTFAIASAGYIPGNNRFPGINLQGPESVNGLQYGIISRGDNPSTGNTPVTGSNALIHYGIVAAYQITGGSFDPGAIPSVVVQYGTSITEPSYPLETPEPTSVALTGVSLIILSVFLRKGKKV